MIETINYQNKDINAGYIGTCLDEIELKKILPTKIKDLIEDTEGTNELIHSFDYLVKTGFEKEVLVDIFRSNIDATSWKTGEALAECYLKENKDCSFYYKSCRDAKNSKSNLTGADLVGFTKIGTEELFLFGEVKTSTDTRCPPQVLYGRSGMIKQLENIMKKKSVRGELIRWVGFKTISLPETSEFKIKYVTALKSYIHNHDKIKVFGILVRDTAPNSNDLSNRYQTLKTELQNGMHLELIALYMPIKISELPNLVRGAI